MKGSRSPLLSLYDLPSPEPICLKRTVTTLYTVTSPQKKPRRTGTTSKKGREKHSIVELGSESHCEAATTIGESVNDQTTTSTAGLPCEVNGASINLPLASYVEEVQSDEYYSYAEAVLNFVTGLFHVSSTLFIVQGWDKKRESAMV